MKLLKPATDLRFCTWADAYDYLEEIVKAFDNSDGRKLIHDNRIDYSYGMYKKEHLSSYDKERVTNSLKSKCDKILKSIDYLLVEDIENGEDYAISVDLEKLIPFTRNKPPLFIMKDKELPAFEGEDIIEYLNDRDFLEIDVIKTTKTTRYHRIACCEWYTEFTDLELEQNNTEEIILLVKEAIQKRQRKFEKIKSNLQVESSIDSRPRTSISKKVKLYVWERDHGKCVRCGSNENIEYDHIIPFSKGGSNTERNIQLLCEDCNRLKSDNIE